MRILFLTHRVALPPEPRRPHPSVSHTAGALGRPWNPRRVARSYEVGASPDFSIGNVPSGT